MAEKNKKQNSIELRVVEALQDDAYKGIARIDHSIMSELNIKRGDVVLIKGNRETVAIADRAYPADVGDGTIRIDGILRRNAKTGIGDVVQISKAKIKEAKKIVIAPAQEGVMVQTNDPEGLKRGLLGRAVLKGDLFVMGGVQRRRNLMSEEFGDLDDIFGNFGELFGNTGGRLGGASQLKFIVASTNPAQPVYISENTEVVLNPKAVEISDEKIPEINYEDIGGLNNEIKKIREMVEIPLKHPEIFNKLGVEPPKGVLLHGPPGTGKTLLAKAVANESEANFILLNGPEIMSKYYGESEKKIRDIFEEAEKSAPSIIFIDEIDAIAPKREDVQGEVERRVVSQILTTMDGLKSRGKVIVIGATNRVNALDPALRRPGRFDRELEVGVPGKPGRLAILKIHTRGMPLDHWDPTVAKQILMERLDLFDGNATVKIEKIEDEITKDKSSQQKNRRKIRENSSKTVLIKDNLLKISRSLKKLELDYERGNGDNYYDINNQKKEYEKQKNSLLDIEEEQENLNSEINTLKIKIKKRENDRIILEKNKRIIGKRQKEIKENKPLIQKLLNSIESLKDILLTRGEEDARRIFVEKNLNEKGELYNLLIEDLISTKIISGELVEDIRKKSIPLMLSELAGPTHGFVGADLEALAKESAMNVLRKVLPEMILDRVEEVPPEILEKLIIKHIDFKDALKTVRPSAMREVLVETPNVNWEDVGGLKEVKAELKEAIEWPLKYPESFERMGIRPNRGILLYGPPGTGKTLLAKAVAKESEANFIQVKGPSLLSMWVGKSEEGIRKIFERARQVAPCVIFFDEIDSIAGKRGGHDSSGRVTERVLNQLLAEMDGLEDLKDILVIAATNRPDMLDQAILRPGRFDKILLVTSPEEKAREQILSVHTKGMAIAKDVNIKDLAKKSHGFTGADLEGLAREAAMLALREDINAKNVKKEHFMTAINKIKPSVTEDSLKAYKKVEESFLNKAKAAVGQEAGKNYFG